MRPNDSIAIISPHLDDAVFSLGEFMQGRQVTIITPFGGYPEDPEGYKKYTILHEEHQRACKLLGVKSINGDFLDDVYPGLDVGKLEEWLAVTIRGYDHILVPLGIRHHDHRVLRVVCDRLKIESKFYYSDLPYATDYPEEHEMLSREMECTNKKLEAVKIYASQSGGTVPERVMQPERIWYSK